MMIRRLQSSARAAGLAALAAIALCLAATPPVRSDDAPVKAYVAASTKEAVDAIAKRFEAETGVAVEVSPGPSSKLAKQIVEGAPADVFLSADQVNADYVQEKHLVARRRNLLGNRLVVVVPSRSEAVIATLADLGREDVRQVALAVEKVPAGEYARQALRKAGAWERVEPKVIGGEDVRATLAFVEGGASAGIVYLTDAIGNPNVRVALEIDPALHAPIEYPLVLIERDRPHPKALELFEYLASEKAAEVFRGARFRVLDSVLR